MANSRRVPIRRCAGCGQRRAKLELVRIVRTPQGAIEVDPTGRLAGRGAYLCITEDCWARGIGKGGLERGLHTSLSTNDRERLLDYQRQQLTGPSFLEQ